MLPFLMQDDGLIMSEKDFDKYNGHHRMTKFCLSTNAASPKYEEVPSDCPVDDLKEWLRPRNISAADMQRWKADPALKILMIQTHNDFSRIPKNGAQRNPTHRTIPGKTEVVPLAGHSSQADMLKDIMRHARLPMAAVGSFIKAHVTFLSTPVYEVVSEDGVLGGKVSSFCCSGSSWTVAWSYFHATRHTSAIMLYREGDGDMRRQEFEGEILRLRQHISHPLFLAFIKTQVSLLWTFNLLEQVNEEMLDIERSVGLSSWDWVLDRELEAEKFEVADEADIEVEMAKRQKLAIEKYNVLTSKVTHIRFRLRSFKDQIGWVRRSNATYTASVEEEATKKEECEELDRVLDRTLDLTNVNLHDADTTADRLTQQMAVMSHLINQRDSTISLAIADINFELAWQGKNANAAMMAIAVASFIFLPSTFVASVFQTPIFNWEPPGNGVVIVEPFWIFWAVCGSTTVLLSLCWLLYMRRRRLADKARRKEARMEFKAKILRSSTWSKRSGHGSNTQRVAPNRGKLWSRTLDEEQGLGVDRILSVEKT